MTQKLEDKIKVLERELALKQAYLSVNFSFAKSSKLPQDVQEQVIAELRSACAQLAEDVENSDRLLRQKEFSDDDIKILQQLVAAVKTNKGRPSPSPSSAEVPRKEPSPASTEEVIKKAKLITLESVPLSIRNRVAPESIVFVKKVQDGRAVVTDKNGVLFHVPEEDLEFEQN